MPVELDHLDEPAEYEDDFESLPSEGGRQPSTLATGMTPEPTVLNDAMAVWLLTFPMPERLREHLAARGLDAMAAEITARLDAVVTTADEHLWAASRDGGIRWDAAFEGEFREVLRRAHPWLDQASIGRVLGYARWLCWHDGLSAADP